MRKKSFKYLTGKKYDSMMSRCYRENDRSYKNYGGRGIRVTTEWVNDIECFREWVKHELQSTHISEEEFVKNSKYYQLDRIDVNGDYTPYNCRLASPQTNARNKRKSIMKKILTAEGVVAYISLLLIFSISCGDKIHYEASQICTVVQTNSGARVQCPDGTSAQIGNGEKGQTGDQGVPGHDAAPGTSVTVVQFCPGDVATYPSEFPEYGLCIDGRLYAVYSTHGGFLAYIPDGDYSSNAVGSHCNFRVNGCVVTP